jgi:hypothetical protein
MRCCIILTKAVSLVSTGRRNGRVGQPQIGVKRFGRCLPAKGLTRPGVECLRYSLQSIFAVSAQVGAFRVFISCLLLRLRVIGTPAHIAHRQIETLLVFPVPALQGVLGWLTQLTNGCPDTFAELDEEFDRSNPVFSRT